MQRDGVRDLIFQSSTPPPHLRWGGGDMYCKLPPCCLPLMLLKNVPYWFSGRHCAAVLVNHGSSLPYCSLFIGRSKKKSHFKKCVYPPPVVSEREHAVYQRKLEFCLVLNSFSPDEMYPSSHVVRLIWCHLLDWRASVSRDLCDPWVDNAVRCDIRDSAALRLASECTTDH